MGPFLRYTALRLVVLVAVGALLWAVGLRYLLWAVLTVVLAAGVSYLLLSGPRDALLERLARSRPAPTDEDAPRRRARPDEDSAAEDAVLDAAVPAPDEQPRGTEAGAPDGPDASAQRQPDAQGERERQL